MMWRACNETGARRHFWATKGADSPEIKVFRDG